MYWYVLAQLIYYVTGEYIGTSGCFPSSELYGIPLNISEGMEKCGICKPPDNIGEGSLPPFGEINLKGMTFYGLC